MFYDVGKKTIEAEIYTDGACSGNPGPGGWAGVIIKKDQIYEISGFVDRTTNQRMELLAAIKALDSLNKSSKVVLNTDSAYLVRAFTEKWLDNWKRNGWVTSQDKPVKNQDLWKKLLKLDDFHDITWSKVKGHANCMMNIRCDKLARDEINKNWRK